MVIEQLAPQTLHVPSTHRGAVHHQIFDSVLVAGVVEDADVRMISATKWHAPRGRSVRAVPAWRKRLGQNLNGDDSIQAGITRLVDSAPSASADARNEFVRAQTFAGENRHGLLLTGNGGEYSAVRHSQDCAFLRNADRFSASPRCTNQNQTEEAGQDLGKR